VCELEPGDEYGRRTPGLPRLELTHRGCSSRSIVRDSQRPDQSTRAVRSA
jgi:hypothetical protein